MPGTFLGQSSSAPCLRNASAVGFGRERDVFRGNQERDIVRIEALRPGRVVRAALRWCG